ncbi:MAG: metallophosphoesterase [Rhodobacteraceae bacterium]|nr:metallophosphoesterase [Paracoccaceae bacterium]
MTDRLHVKSYRLSLPRWPVGARLKIVMVADLHASWPWMRGDKIARIVDQANELGGDLICLMGDYVAHYLLGLGINRHAVVPEEVAHALSRLEAPLGRYAVFGNHDWHDDPDAKRGKLSETRWHRAFRNAGVPTLDNRHVTLNVQGHPVILAGLDSQRAFHRRFKRPILGAHDVVKALGTAPSEHFTILLAHEPDVFTDLSDAVDLTLSGHTHGGQILIGGRPRIVPSRHGTRFAYGHHRIGQRDLVVSGGLGCSGVPFRWGVPPELTVVELGTAA